MMAQPRATYRVQLRPEFTLANAVDIVPYLSQLGISHLYNSPFLQAAAGSAHGYDVVDHSRINRELGGQPALERLIDVLRGEGLGQIVDMVPNHMAIDPLNPWWYDVLKNGPSSPYASYFDVEWDPPETRHANAVLVPVLGDQYGRVLEAGEVKVVFEDHAFTVRYYDHLYPVDPRSLGGILSAAAERLSGETASKMAFLAGAQDRLPDATDLSSARRRFRDAAVLANLLVRLEEEHPEVTQAIQEVVNAVNADPDALDVFLRRQNYRLAYWKISSRELGYRRFFDINTMIGLRMEDEEVYRDTHVLVLDLLKRGLLDGLRIDHPDGLRDPQQYFERLRASTQPQAPEPQSPPTPATASPGQPAWIVIEKILEPGERLPDNWPVDGTTGYDFLNRLNGLFVDPEAEQRLTDFYQQFTGLSTGYAALVHEKKIMVAKEVLGSDLGRLTELFLQVCDRHRRYRDYTRSDLHEALAEIAACLPVYRTFIRPDAADGAGEYTLADEAYIDEAVEKAKTNRPDLDPRLFDFFCDLMLLRERGTVERELVERFQQFSGPVMAKGVEDTVFYLYNRLVSLNEVGGDPARFGLSPEAFHQACLETRARWPLSMLATTTHDTKRSEDVRARLNVLTEIPGEWAEAVTRWAEMNEPQRRPAGEQRALDCPEPLADGKWPDRNLEYLLYQTLVGAWPVTPERVVEYLQKAGREAKLYTSWTAPNEAYEEAAADFATSILADSRFVADLETFVARVLEAGRINTLAQTLLKLTLPGIPDLYQGSELWTLSLVDPDNRRPVDYDLRRSLLDRLADDTPPETVLTEMEQGLPKLWVIRQALALRRAHPAWFGPESTYEPLAVEFPAPVETATAEELAGRTEHPETEPHASALPRKARYVEDAAQVEEIAGMVAITGLADNQPAAESQLAENQPVESLAEPDAARSAGAPALAFQRGENVLVAVPRLTMRYRADWSNCFVTLPAGRWHNRLTQETLEGGRTALSTLWAKFPAALLVKED